MFSLDLIVWFLWMESYAKSDFGLVCRRVFAAHKYHGVCFWQHIVVELEAALAPMGPWHLVSWQGWVRALMEKSLL